MGIQRLPTFTDYMQQRVYRKNQNLILLTVGGTGSGKSYSQLKEAEGFYEKTGKGDYPISNVCFSAKELMKLINSGKLKKGDLIIYEEVGINQSSRNWYGLINKLMNFLLQSFRNMNIVFMMNTPDVTFIDSQTRKLLHFIFEPTGIDINKKICKVKPLQLQVNRKTGKIYMKYLRILKDGEVLPLKRINYGLPSKRLTKEYEAKKKEFTQRLNKEILKEIIREESKGDKKDLTEQQQKVLDMLKDGKVIIDISKGLSIENKVVYDHMKALKKKGWNIKPKKEGNRVLYYDIY